MTQFKLLIVVLCFLVLSFGCGDGGGEKFPEVNLDPAVVAGNIMAEFDKDSDGEVSKSELKKNKGLMMLTQGEQNLQQQFRLDSDGSGGISEEEFTKRFAECFKDKRQGYNCTVMLRNVPLEDATVTLVPASFMGEIPAASGETDYDGNCSVSTPDGLAGAVPGIYTVEITHPEKKIPAKYNDKSTIIVALDPTNPYANEGVPTFKLR